MANYVLAANRNVTAAPGIKAKQLQVAGTIKSPGESGAQTAR
jgi:hypothetical protein